MLNHSWINSKMVLAQRWITNGCYQVAIIKVFSLIQNCWKTWDRWAN